ncbi:hypothetical protein COHA_005223 [Chlorella ohadii]|uniref:Methyltransferase FkbM domain-containing protein n=1 Tax=Chlorella ohadii TaxID=2649997 RepID=A0AAD5H1T6_9CHLO|nr:hypothetical protein COHA_005223 [Chlorella ohadii]
MGNPAGRWAPHLLGGAIAVTLILLLLTQHEAVVPTPAAAEVDALHAEVVKVQQAGHELQDRMQAGGKLLRPEKWSQSSIMVLNDAPLCHIESNAGGGQTGQAVNGSIAGSAGLDALKQQHRQLQEQFCQQLATGKPNPLGTPGNETYRRLPGVRAVGNAAVAYPMWLHGTADIVSGDVVHAGVWESAETSGILQLLQEWRQAHSNDPIGPVLLDIGANLGWFSLQAAAAGFSVLAVEPMPHNQGAFRRTLCENPDLAARITLIPKGLSDKPRKCRLYVNKNNVGNGVPVCEGAAFAELQNSPEFKLAGEFELTTLDDLFSSAVGMLAGRLQVIKIDVEGFEPQVFAGGRKFTAAAQPQYIVAELNQGFNGTTSPQQLLNMYNDLGYAVHMYDFHGPLLLPKTYDTLAQTLFAPGSQHSIYMERLQSCSQR